VLSNGHIILSTEGDETIAGVSFLDGDLIEFDPVGGTATFAFHESLFSGSADIDGVAVLANGNILLSTADAATLGGLTFGGGDIVEYNSQTDVASLFFSESLFTSGVVNVDGVSLLSNSNLVLTTTTNETLGGLTFRDGDLVEYNRTTGAATLYFDEDLFTAGAADVDAVSVR